MVYVCRCGLKAAHYKKKKKNEYKFFFNIVLNYILFILSFVCNNNKYLSIPNIMTISILYISTNILRIKKNIIIVIIEIQ